MLWRCRNFAFSFPRPALVMGIVNVTPDSFWDGGRHHETQRAVDHALQLVGEGAELIDVGGESTRPGARPVTEEEEISRVIPVIRALAPQVTIPISIDTRKAAVARAALEAGASVVNDVEASRTDPALWKVVAGYGAGYVAMHMQGDPETMQSAPAYRDGNVVGEVERFFQDRLARLAEAGVSGDQVVLDPGVGFGKTLDHNLQLLAGLKAFLEFGRPLMIGISRKSFLGALLGVEPSQRLAAGLACTDWARREGALVFRTHDVASTVQSLRMTEALLERSPLPLSP